MFDTLKLIYTQEEAFELVSRYEKAYKEKIEELEEENKKLKSERDKWRGKYNRLKSEFNLLKNKIGTTQK